MSNFRADLHMHSYYSDGTCSPEELIIKAKQEGLQGMSITDHDSIAAYDEAMLLAKKHDIALISGVEFSAMYNDESVHILGYSFSLKSKELHALCHSHRQRRQERNANIFANLKALGIEVTSEAFEDGDKTWGRPHIAEAFVKTGVVSSIQEAFDIYLGEGKKAYDPGEPISVQETIETIHKAGGVAIIAHPHLIKKKRVINKLLEFDFDGLEGYYASLPSFQERKWLVLAQEKKWLITGGSDYHGTIKPYTQLGSSWVDEATFRILYERFRRSEQD